MELGDYVNGYIERKTGGRYEGTMKVEGIDLSPIMATYFKKDGCDYVWIRRKKALEYDLETESYVERERKPYFEAYMKRQSNGDAVAYKGEFTFMRFKFSMTGVWDRVLGKDKQRLNLYVERLPMQRQTIINAIRERREADG